MAEEMSCTLHGDELAARLVEWAGVTRHAIDRRVEADRIVSTYPPEDDIVHELRRLIAAEASCCSFMDFSMNEQPDKVVVELRVPNGMAESIGALLGAGPATSDLARA